MDYGRRRFSCKIMASDCGDNHSSSVGVVDSDSAVFDESDDIRLRTKSLVVTDTRQGQSALVPGLSAVKTPCEQDGVKVKPFTTIKTSHTAHVEQNTKIIVNTEPKKVRNGKFNCYI